MSGSRACFKPRIRSRARHAARGRRQRRPGNLALACRACNVRKSHAVAAVDPFSGERVPLFNPRHDDWAEHCRLLLVPDMQAEPERARLDLQAVPQASGPICALTQGTLRIRSCTPPTPVAPARRGCAASGRHNDRHPTTVTCQAESCWGRCQAKPSLYSWRLARQPWRMPTSRLARARRAWLWV